MKIYKQSEAKENIKKLVNFFDDNKDNNIDETIIRREFVDKLFTYLNWDIQNQKQNPLNEKYVYEEERISIEGTMKRTDYTFCHNNGGTNNRAFFVEAKAPKVNIETELEPAFQVRRYGWSAGLYISVLTNFEKLAIYNTKNIEPSSTDRAAIGRVELIKYTEYVDKFEQLWNLFEFNNVLEGSIKEYAKEKGIISDTFAKSEKTVDNAFLEQIEEWRKMLAREIVLRSANNFMNSDKEKINFAVQKIIDRIIFLRIIEDRGLEDYGNLKTIAKSYKSLCQLFEYADRKYNSGLFHFSQNIERGIPDTITQKLHIVDVVIQDIISSLYGDSPYMFDVMPAYILGSVYERFLGKEIDLTNKNIKIDDKPAVRKAGGVYYTPEYIVDYIVQNTIPKKQNIKILDPACGSGSFLLVAYQYILDIYQRKSPNKKLTLNERKQILLEHIYGVDIDEQAVEVTKLSLLLKVLEGISKEEIEATKRKSEHALPSLHNNIKCGNSLIDDVEIAGEKAFVWEEEFAGVFSVAPSIFAKANNRTTPSFAEANATPPREGNWDKSSPPVEGKQCESTAGWSQTAGCSNESNYKREFLKYSELPYNPKLKQRAKELRKANNLAEALLWNELKNKKFHKLDFDRQKIIGNYIVDFFNANYGVVIEIDGCSHNNKMEYDEVRDAYLEGLGLMVIHISDMDVRKNMANVLKFIESKFTELFAKANNRTSTNITTPNITTSNGTTPSFAKANATPPQEALVTKYLY
ncbi:MAG: DUF559 domain-containing protein [Bacteroidetes bacterium]|nr:DUF559 domain-containing protein [Bacteroidota bacterium]